MSNCQVPMPTYERPEPVGELVDSLKRENDALKQLVRDWAMAPCAVCDPWDEHFACEHFDGCDCTLGVRMTELGIVWEVG